MKSTHTGRSSTFRKIHNMDDNVLYTMFSVKWNPSQSIRQQPVLQRAVCCRMA